MTTDVKVSAETQLTLRRVVRVLIALGLCCWAYWAACLSSKGMTFGGISGEYGPTGSDGQPTDGPILSVSMELGPSLWTVFLALLIVIAGVTVAGRRASVADADRVLRSTVAVLVGFTVLAIVTAQTAFGLTPLREDMTDGERVWIPFGVIDVTVTDVYQEYLENFEQMEG
ncbi:hypothetical protein SAMN06298212_12512 [Ruaniaceae bacterium KH17]|nr:hypothetical protein SAMN06298212_12512 [Ruaniaceae bacterium KH17]